MDFVSADKKVKSKMKLSDGSRNNYIRGLSLLTTSLCSQLILRIHVAIVNTNKLGGDAQADFAPGAGIPW